MLPHLHATRAEADVPPQPGNVERRADPIHTDEDCSVHDAVLRGSHQRKDRRNLHKLHEDEPTRNVRLILYPNVEPLVTERLEDDVRSSDGEQDMLVPHRGNEPHGSSIHSKTDRAHDAQHCSDPRHCRRKPLLIITNSRHCPDSIDGDSERSEQNEVGDDRVHKLNTPDAVRSEDARHIREHDRRNQQVQDEPHVAEYEVCLYRSDFHTALSP